MAMSVFERTAVFTIIETIEGQLRGLKVLLAAAGNDQAAPAHNVVRSTQPSDTTYTNDDEEARLAELFQRQEEITKMTAQAETQHQRLWAESAREQPQG